MYNTMIVKKILRMALSVFSNDKEKDSKKTEKDSKSLKKRKTRVELSKKTEDKR